MELYEIFSLVVCAASLLLLGRLVVDFFFSTTTPFVRHNIEVTCTQGEYTPLVSFLVDELNNDDQWIFYHKPAYSKAAHRYYGISVCLEQDVMELNIGSVGGNAVNLLSDNNLLMTMEEKKTMALPAMNLLLYSQSRLINDISCDFPLNNYDPTLEDTI